MNRKKEGRGKIIRKKNKKDSLLQPDYLDILWIKPSRFWQMKLRKKCQKRVRKDRQKDWKIEKFTIKAAEMDNSCSRYLVSDGSLWVEKYYYIFVKEKGTVKKE